MPASAITIQELSGRQRTLTLVGPGLPIRGASWPIEQRLVTEWFPGNSIEATQQVLGPMDMPSEWEGVWNTTRLIGSPCVLSEAGAEIFIVRAFTMHETFEDIVRAGSLLRVTWTGDQNRKIQREGRIGSYKPAFDRTDDLHWSASFVWTGRGGNTQKTVPQDENVLAAMRAVVQAMTDIQSALSSVPTNTELPDIPADVPTLGVEDLEAIAAAPGELLEDISTSVSNVTGRVSRTVAALESFAAVPDQLANQATIAAKDTLEAVQDIERRINSLPSETYSAPGVGVGRTLRLVRRGTNVYRAAFDAEGRALAVEAAARKVQLRPTGDRRTNDPGPNDLVVVHIARSGDTFNSIALRYYGDASLAGEIARANKLARYTIAPTVGSRLLIPSKVRSNSA